MVERGVGRRAGAREVEASVPALHPPSWHEFSHPLHRSFLPRPPTHHLTTQLLAYSANRGPLAHPGLSSGQWLLLLLLPFFPAKREVGAVADRSGGETCFHHGAGVHGVALDRPTRPHVGCCMASSQLRVIVL